MTEPYLAIQVVMMPKDANPMVNRCAELDNFPLHMTIFGGVILSYIDQAGAIGARHEILRAGGKQPALATVAMNRVEFKHPVHVGDVVRFLTRVLRIGRTSIAVHVTVEAERGPHPFQAVTEAEVIYVNVEPGSPVPRPVPLF